MTVIFKIKDRVKVKENLPLFAGRTGIVKDIDSIPEVLFDNGDRYPLFQRHLELYKGPETSDKFTEGTPIPPEAPQDVYIMPTHDTLTLSIPEGTERLEGEFDGYKVTLEKIKC